MVNQKYQKQNLNKINVFHNYVENFFYIFYNKYGDDFMEFNDIKRVLEKELEKVNDLWRSL